MPNISGELPSWFRSTVWLGAGLVMTVAAAEAFFAMSYLGFFAKAFFIGVFFSGVLLPALILPKGPLVSTLTTRLLVPAVFSFYLTATAFFRYRGLAKDLEPTFPNLSTYFLRVFLVITLFVMLTMIGRILLGRRRSSRTLND